MKKHNSNLLVNLQNSTRSPEYQQVIGTIGKRGICPFCPEHLATIHPFPIETRQHWHVTENAYPYKPKKTHLLLIHREHIEDLGELSPEAWNELLQILKMEQQKRGIEGGTFMMRFGNTRFTGASVTHLHAQLFQSDPGHPDYDPQKGVMTRVG